MRIFPDDDNGDTLLRLAERGDRLEEARDIQFDLVFADRAMAERFCNTIQTLGFPDSSMNLWEKMHVWNVCVQVFMRPEHEAITQLEHRFRNLAGEFLGDFDGWGCFIVE